MIVNISSRGILSYEFTDVRKVLTTIVQIVALVARIVKGENMLA